MYHWLELNELSLSNTQLWEYDQGGANGIRGVRDSNPLLSLTTSHYVVKITIRKIWHEPRDIPIAGQVSWYGNWKDFVGQVSWCGNWRDFVLVNLAQNLTP